MRLFHGTSTYYKSPLLKAGVLRPRGKRKGNYEGKLVSDPEKVYLTDVYAPQFGLISSEEKSGRPLIVAVRVEDDLILPDTDFTETGEHRLKLDCGLQCLEKTGCCSVVGEIEIESIYIPELSWWKEFSQQMSTRIETGFRHKAFYQIHKEQLEAFLFYSDRIDRSDF